MIRSDLLGSEMFVSISAKNGARSPVSSSTRMIGESAASESSGVLNDGRFVTDTPAGNDARMKPDGEKPSQRENRFESTGMLSTFVGMPSAGSASRTPV